MNDLMVYSLPQHTQLREQLAEALASEQGDLTVREFPDGETYVRGVTPCEGRDVALVVNLFHPNPLVLPLLFCVRAVRLMGASRVVLVTPYLPYMRQDARFQPGEVVTSRIFASVLSAAVDGLVTIDPHLHRYSSLDEIYSVPTDVVNAAPSISTWIRNSVRQAVVIGPDRESEQWIRDVAESAGVPYLVLSKSRSGDREVHIDVPAAPAWHQLQPVLVDDIISTGQTLMESARELILAGYKPPICVAVHALFSDPATEEMREAGATRVVSCNSVGHSTNEIDLVPDLAAGVRRLFSELPS